MSTIESSLSNFKKFKFQFICWLSLDSIGDCTHFSLHDAKIDYKTHTNHLLCYIKVNASLAAQDDYCRKGILVLSLAIRTFC